MTKTRPKRAAQQKNVEEPARGKKTPAVARSIKIQRALYEIADAASAVTDMQEFYAKLHAIVATLMHAGSFYVTLYDAATGLLSSPYFADESGDLPPPPTQIDEANKSLRAHVLLQGKTLHISGDRIEEGKLQGRFEPKGTPAEDWIGVPLKLDGQVIGSLTVQSYQKGVRYEARDVRLLEFVAQHIAVALTRARLIEETRQRNSELLVVNGVQAGIASQLDIQAIYELVGDKVCEIFDANTVVLATFDVEKNLMYRHYIIERGRRYQVDPTPISSTWQQFIRRGQSALINNHLLEYMQRIDPDFKVVVGEMPKSSLSVPLRIQGEISGVISLQNVDRENAFSESDQQLLETLAHSLSVALANARLFEEAQQRNEELAIINSVQQGLASKLDMPAIYELIGEKVREVFHVEVIDIVSYDPEANLISMPYSYENGDRSVISPREPYGFRLQVIESGTPLLINYDFVSLASQYKNPLLTGAWPKSALFVPLLVEGQVRNIISIQDLERENAFSDSDVQLLQTLSNAMAVALENARLFDETQRLLNETEHRAQELATVNTVSAALAGELDLSTLIELVGEQVRSVFKADIAFVALLDKEKGVINFPYQYGEPADPLQLGQGLTSRIIQSRQPLLINQDMDRQRQQMGVTLVGRRARSFLGVPIFVSGEPIGVVSVQSTRQEGLFTENDRRLLSTIATNVGSAFQNARLFQETQRLFQAEQRAHEQAETLRSVAQALNRSLSLTEVFNLVLIEIQKVIPYDSAGIYQVHENHRVFVTGRGFANLDDLIGVSFEFNQEDDEIGYLISQSLQPLILEDASKKYPQYFRTGLHAATEIRSYMAVPIVLNENLIGMITLDREQPGFYKAQHADLAMAFAAQAATAINNARLFDETRQRNTELAVINSVQEGLASNLDIQSIYTLVGDKIRETFTADTTFIVFKDDERNLLLASYYADRTLRRSFSRPYGTGIAEGIIESGRPLLLGSAQEQERYGAHHVTSPGATGDLNQSVLGVPIFRNGRACGAVSVQSYKINAFDEDDLRLLQTLTNSMSVALENARLFNETQQRNTELAIINSVQEGLASKLDMQVIYELVGEKIRSTFNAQVVNIVTYDRAAQVMHGRYYFEDGKVLPGMTLPSFGFRKYVVESGQPIVINKDMPLWMQEYNNPVVQGSQTKSAVFMPILLGNEAIGVISLQNKDHENAFSESDVQLLETLANSMSVALENARLWEQEKLYRKALERELEIGREIQTGFLPDELPVAKGWEIAALLMPAREVAGDFYDAFELPDGNIGLVIADVCDKGVGAALFMTLFRSLIRITANQDYFEDTENAGTSFFTAEHLQRTLTLTNNYIAETHHASGMFATLFFGILDPQAGRLMYINGGHEPPLLIQSGNVRGSLSKTGPAVGAIPGCHFDVQTVQLEPGEMLFAFTDGAPEARDPRGEFFGHERLLQSLRQGSNSTQELIRTIEAELHTYIDGITQFDDITLLAVRRVD